MVSFQEEGEGTVAAVWFSVAHNAEGTKEKMAAYKKAISTIKVGLHAGLLRVARVWLGRVGSWLVDRLCTYFTTIIHSYLLTSFLVPSQPPSLPSPPLPSPPPHTCIILQNASNGWQKVHYLLEFGEWLLSSQHPKATALAQVGCCS